MLGAHGHAGKHAMPAPGWKNVRRQVEAAEAAGFDLCVIEDALVAGGMNTWGYWEAASLAGAVAASSSRIALGHSVMNVPLRAPALMAKIAATLDEISGGRYVLGIGAGNTPEDYEAFGFAADRRYSRAAEAIEIVHRLLREERVEHDGAYFRVRGELVPRGPRPQGPPIVIGAARPKMMRLAARFGDAWSGWTPEPQTIESFRPMIDELERACREIGRDPSTLVRTVDLALDPHRFLGKPAGSLTPFLISGTTGEIAEKLLAFRALGIEEVRCMLWPEPPPESRPEILLAMADVVSAVHSA